MKSDVFSDEQTKEIKRLIRQNPAPLETRDQVPPGVIAHAIKVAPTSFGNTAAGWYPTQSNGTVVGTWTTVASDPTLTFTMPFPGSVLVDWGLAGGFASIGGGGIQARITCSLDASPVFTGLAFNVPAATWVPMSLSGGWSIGTAGVSVTLTAQYNVYAPATNGYIDGNSTGPRVLVVPSTPLVEI